MAIPKKPVAARPKRPGAVAAAPGRTSTSAGCPTGRATGGSRATSSATTTNRSAATSAGPAGSRRGTRPARPPPPRPTLDPGRPVPTRGPFGDAQAVRLLNRAGFGPVPGQAEQLASLGLVGAVQSLTRPSGAAVLTARLRVDDDGNPLAPADAWGHDHLWWLDRMVRTNQPLVERMALVLHDWFATSNADVSKQQQMIDQSNLFRGRCFGSFLDLFKAVTIDPAMLQWLNGNENHKGAPNENYAREMMELFSLEPTAAPTARTTSANRRGADRVAQRLVGRARRPQLPLRPKRHDTAAKTVFGQTGNWGWEDACRLCVEHPLHPSFFVEKLWSYFVADPPSSASAMSWSPPTATRAGDPAGARGDPDQPRALRGPADGQTAGRAAGGRCCGRSAARSTRRPGPGSATRPDSCSSGRPTSPAGTTSAGSTRRGCGPAGTSSTYAIDKVAVDPWDETTARPRPPRKRWRGRPPPGARPRCATSTAPSCSSSPAAARTDHRQLAEGPYRAMRQNGLLQLIGVGPDLVLQ